MNLHEIKPPKRGYFWAGDEPCGQGCLAEGYADFHHRCPATREALPTPEIDHIAYCECGSCTGTPMHYFLRIRGEYICTNCRNGAHPQP